MLLEKKHEDFVGRDTPTKQKNNMLNPVLMNDSEVFKEPYVVKHQKLDDSKDVNGFGALNDQTTLYVNNDDAQVSQTTLGNLKLDSQCSFTGNQAPQKKR